MRDEFLLIQENYEKKFLWVSFCGGLEINLVWFASSGLEMHLFPKRRVKLETFMITTWKAKFRGGRVLIMTDQNY